MVSPRGARRFLLRGFVLLGVGALGASCAQEPAAPPIRNLILVSLDTLRADHLGLYGYPRETSPNLDRFARDAVVFERANSQASSTRPSHQSLFQSVPPSAADANRLGLAEVLSANGFRTAAYTGGGNIAGRLGFARGFELYEEGGSGLAGSLPLAASWIRAHRDERFFLFLHTYDIHLPYDPPEPHASMFTEGYSGPIRGDNTRENLRRVRGLGGHADEAFDLDARDRERVVSLYDGGIHYADSQLGRLFALAEELDLHRDTLFVFFSDHGEEFWEHGSAIHSHTLYQELLHVPLIVRAPGMKPGRVVASVPLMDLSPTILELLEIPVPDRFEGRSLVELIAGEATANRPVLGEQRRMKSWMEYPWKLVREEASGELQLFDLSDDPREQRNRASDREDVASRLSTHLDARLGGEPGREVLELEPGIEDPEHLERLRALGYIE